MDEGQKETLDTNAYNTQPLDQVTFELTTDEERLDTWLADTLKETSRSQIQKWIEKGLVTVNGNKVVNKTSLKKGDLVLVVFPKKEEPLNANPEKMDLDIIYEDRDIIVLNKPSGMVVHPSIGHKSHTLVNGLLAYCESLKDVGESFRPGIVHRIDKDTSGLLVVAKNSKSHSVLAKEIAKHNVIREYTAIVAGIITESSGTINAPIGRDQKNRLKRAVVKGGKEAITHFKVVERFNTATEVVCHLETGRTHQIRVHFDYIKHPILNDPMYNNDGKPKTEFGQYLHAGKLSFNHPITKEKMTFTAALPKEFAVLLNSLNKR